MLIWLTTARTKRKAALGRVERCNGVAAKPSLVAGKGAQTPGVGSTGGRKGGSLLEDTHVTCQMESHFWN